eukprot:Tamp_09823.p1 GENE.Tamp_09823~~Tamp_09823.p1  ORF type:complete len:395 (-),score=50.33 Tamp_09823:771-1955(-)
MRLAVQRRGLQAAKAALRSAHQTRASIVEHTFGAPTEQQFRMFSRPTSTSVGAQARLCAGTPVRSTAAARAGRDQGAEQGVTVELPPALQRRAMSVYTLGVSTQAYAGSQSTSMHVAAKCGMEARGAHLRREALAGVKAVCGRRALSGGSSSSGGGGGGPGGGGELTLKERFKVMAQDYGKVIMVSHSTIWAGSLLGAWLVIKSHQDDMTAFLQLLPESIASHIDPSAGAFAIAFVLIKLTGPFRLMIDIAITPMLAKYLRRTWLAGPLGLHSLPRTQGRLTQDLTKSARERMRSVGSKVKGRYVSSRAGVGAKLLVAATIRKSLPRLKWVRLREKIVTPVSGASTASWRARTWQAVGQGLSYMQTARGAPMPGASRAGGGGGGSGGGGGNGRY